MADPHFASVVLLAVNDNAANGTTTFVDQSSYARTLTRVGGAIYTNATAPTGMFTSAALDGAGDGVTFADAAALEPGSGDFTFEVFFRPNSVTSLRVIVAKGSLGYAPFILATDGTSLKWWATSASGSWNVAEALTIGTVAIGNWYYGAIRRSGSTFTSSLNGVAGTGASSASALLNDTNAWNLGVYGGGFDYNGHIACVRYTVGVARDISSVPSLPFPITALDPPVADFTGTPLSGQVPLTVNFTDQSTNTPTSWLWDFGDSQTSTQQNPSHDYAAAGTYSVTLTATNAAGSSAPLVKTDYITVTAAPVASTTRTSGVKKKPPKIRLSTSTKEELGAFLRSQLNLKHAPPEAPVEPVVSAQEVEKERKRLAKQARKEKEIARKVERARQAAEKFEREREATEIQAAKDNKIQDNNMRLLIMLAASV